LKSGSLKENGAAGPLPSGSTKYESVPRVGACGDVDDLGAPAAEWRDRFGEIVRGR